MDPEVVLEQLRSAWLIITSDGSTPPMESPFHSEGVAASIYTEASLAQVAADRYPESAEVSVQTAPPLWESARLLAEQGFAGVLVDEQFPLFFVTTEPEGRLPTHVALPQGEELLVVGQEGVTDLRRADVRRWIDLEAFDRLSIRWLLGQTRPFAGYEIDMPLYEYLPGGEPQPVAERGSLLEPKEQVDSTIPFFSTAFAAEWYWETHAGVHLTGVGEQAKQLAAHNDINEVLDARAEAFPQQALILNPGRHRFYQGFFRKVEEGWFLVTINGVWFIAPPFRCMKVARRS